MNKKINIAVLTLASALFTAVLANGSPTKNVEAYDDFIVALHSKTFLRVETGMDFTVALTTENEVFTFGRNNLGQLGNDTLVDSNKAINITSFFSLPANYIITDIDAGDNHALAVATNTVTENQKIYLWGDNNTNQLGFAATTSAFEKKPRDMSTEFVVGGVVNKAVASEANTLVWTNGNAVRTAGRNTFGVLGNNSVVASTTPVAPTFSGIPLNSMIDVGLYANTAYALTSGGLVYIWGNNASRQVGNNSDVSTVNIPTNITSSFGLTAPEKVVSVATGENHSVALTSAGEIFFWGTVLNNSIAEALTNFTIKATPFNVTTYFYTTAPGDNSPLFGPEGTGDDYYQIPLAVEAGSDSTFIKFDYVDVIGGIIEPTNYEEFVSMGKNIHNGIYALIDWEEEDAVIKEPRYMSYQYYDEGGLVSISFSKTNHIVLNKEGDFTMFGSNEYGQMGLGFDSEPGVTEFYNYNYSYDVRDFENDVYSELPANLTAPLNDYFELPGRSNEYFAIYGETTDWGSRYPGIVDYYFDDYFTEKEWELITPIQLTKMRSIFAEIFEDQVLYGWVPSTNEELLTYLKDNLGDRYYLREDMEGMTNYQSWDLSWDWDNLVTLDDEIIALLDADVEPRLDEFRAILANIQDFENNFLKPFIDSLAALELSDPDLYDFVYVDEEKNDLYWLDLYQEAIADLIELDYEDDILAIFAEFESLTELEQLLLNEYYGLNYEELYLEYYDYFADSYSDELSEFETDIQDGEWSWYWPLFENLSDLETLLAGRDGLNEISYDLFVEMYGQENEFFSYDMYEYWIWLNDLLPHLVAGKPVYDQIVTIEELDLDNLDATTIKAISDMYEDYLALSEEAQDLIDSEYDVEWLLSLIIEQVEGDIETLPGTIEDFDALFNDAETKDATINELLGAWNKFQAMSDDLKDDMDPEARAHLEALYARYLELTRPSVDLVMIGLILVHLFAGVYFAFKKRDVLVKPVQ
jgi:alpha-tubulin suppressor-like RCC1 family protein